MTDYICNDYLNLTNNPHPICRHVQREHRHIAGRIPTKFGSTRVLPDPLVAAAAVAQAQQQQRLAAAASQSGSLKSSP